MQGPLSQTTWWWASLRRTSSGQTAGLAGEHCMQDWRGAALRPEALVGVALHAGVADMQKAMLMMSPTVRPEG